MTDSSTGTPQLKRALTLVDVVSIGVGSAVGVSIFSVMAPAATVAGSGMLLAFAIAAVPMIVFAVVYGFMGSAVPRSGASFDWPTRFVHPFVGFMIAWLRILANVGAMTLLTLVLVNYASRVVALPRVPTMIALLFLFYLANLLGVRFAASVERILVAFKLIAFATFVVVGATSVHTANLQPVLGTGTGGLFAVLPILMALYMGLESATEVGEEIIDSTAVIARGLGVALIVTIVVYLSVSGVALGALGATALGTSDAPLFDAGAVFLGRWNTPLILVAAVASIGTSINAIYITFARFLFAMGRDGVFPAALAKIHPRWSTPHVAITAVFVLAVIGLLLPTSLVFLFLAVTIPTLLKYISTCWSAWRLVDQHPALHAAAHFRLSRRAVKLWSAAGIVFGVLIIAAGAGADRRLYAVLAVWIAAGCVYWVMLGDRASRSMRALRMRDTLR
ncbi:MAG: amino acid permease [Gemmatimonadetes bacterium]|nr:amino acid permease [Gemmatimonadota bacterium]